MSLGIVMVAERLGGKRVENGEQRAVRGGENAKTTRNDD
jgi:hypothetical protein